MYLQEILEVAIGMVFVWLVLSVATMSFQEWIASLLNTRAKDLEKAISWMLTTPGLVSTKNWTTKFYDYPLIANLFPKPKQIGRKSRLPSYIPSQKFGAALFELIIKAGTDGSPVLAISNQIDKQLSSIKSPEQQKLARADWEAIIETAGNVAASGVGEAALDSLKFQVQSYGEKHPEFKPTIDDLIPQINTFYGNFVESQIAAEAAGADSGLPMRQFRLGMLALQKTNPGLARNVSAIIRQTEVFAKREEESIASIRENLESWFNDSMDRLSGTYKRKSQLIAFIIGVILALILNVDSVNVAVSLWREPTLRQTIIAEAQNYTQPAANQPGSNATPLQNISALETELQALNIPFGWNLAGFDTAGGRCSILPFKTGQVWGIPTRNTKGQTVCNRIANLPPDLNGWLMKILGMLITGAAAAQGAPFWFDILKKLVNVRGTGVNPDEQPALG